jgi:hypothetical protein
MQNSTQDPSSVGASTAQSDGVSGLINRACYPIDDPSAPSAQRAIADGRAQLARDGLGLFPDFLAPQALSAMAGEARALHASAYHAEQAQTDDGSGRLKGFTLPRLSRNSSSAVAYDLLAASSPIRLLYEWESLVGFVRELLGVEHLYRCADPIISCLLMYYDDGDELGWHFDPNDGVVTLLLQAAEEGGEFEFAPNIRRDDAEGRAAVAKVMDGSREDVVTPMLRPGTLSVFQGVNSLHRVTKVRGTRPRIILTMSFDTEPDTLFSDEIRRRYSGRIA